MSEKSELRKKIKKESRELYRENRWNLVLGNLLCGAAVSSTSAAVGLVLGGPLAYGMADFTLKVVRKDESKSTADLFKGFSNQFGRSIVAFILEAVYLALWFLLFIIPGIIKSFSYSMTFYLLHDHPELEGNDAITKSRELMKGHKWDLFVLRLSFIGWILLSCLTFGILAILFVNPWMSVAQAKFYESIKEQSQA